MNENQAPRLMLMFTIGPVQSFIEAARKTEDLWMGSYILSYLIATAMERVQGDGVEIIYPAIGTDSPFDFWREQDPTTPSFPNLFLAIAEGSKVAQDALFERAREAEDRVKAEFESMAKCVLDKAFSAWRSTYVEKLYKRQITDFFHVYWVITGEVTGQKYGDWYAHTASSLAAIKNCRTFAQTQEVGRKCSLDGTREVLHLEENESIKDAMEWWDTFAKRSPRHCRQKEALCAISLTKRMGMHFLENYSKFSKEFMNSRPRFPSTSEVATANYKEQILCEPDVLEVYTDFCHAVKSLRQSDDEDAKIPTIQPLPKIKCPLPNNVDGEWLYEETLDPNYLERYYNVDVSAVGRIEQCKKLRKKLVQLLKDEPGKYYSAIALDADNMGEVNRNAESREQHANNSKQLIDYAKKARRIVEEKHLGKLTYAGGDDLLALANLKDLLSILKMLHKEFPDFTTISAGVCIAHNKMPLGDVLQHARRMEKKAKDDGERNAFGIVLFKRSGNVSEMVTKWNYGDLEVLTVGQKLAKLLQNDEISKRFLYTFRDAFVKLIGDDRNHMIGLPSELVDKEFKRIIERAAYKTKGQELDKRSKRVVNLTLKMWTNFNTFTEYIHFLEIITFISRESK